MAVVEQLADSRAYQMRQARALVSIKRFEAAGEIFLTLGKDIRSKEGENPDSMFLSARIAF